MRNVSLISLFLVLGGAIGWSTGCMGGHTNLRPLGDAGGGGGGGDDASANDPADMAPVFSGTCDNTHLCPMGKVCFEGMCIADNGTCQSDNECQNDTYCDCVGGGGGDAGPCMGGICLPYGTGPRGAFDPDCTTPGFAADKFVAPKLKCSWPAPANFGTLMTPIVADLDGDKKPEIIFESYPSGFTALHGKDCTVYFDKTYSFSTSNQSQLAVADLDGDKIPEIIGVDASKHVVVFDNKGNEIAKSPTPYTFAGGQQDWGGPAIADVDNKAPPEIIVAGQVTRYIKGNKVLQVLFTNNPVVPEFGPLTIVADMDGDGKPEIVAGKAVYDGVTGADKTPVNLAALSGAGAFPAIGDFNNDKKPDIVLVQAQSGQEQVSIFDYANNKFIFGPYPVPNGWGGPPTVADFDGDGQPEFATAGPHNYFVFKPACAAKNKPAKCDKNSTIGVLWQKTTQDVSSGGTGSSVFDFNGDGAAEVVYRDECWLRVYNGIDGKTVFAANVTSATALEVPVVADVDNDGHADIVVCADKFIQSCPMQPEMETGTPWTGAVSGILVYQDPKNRWMPSRGLWNQHSYHITNVNDDLTIPTTEKNNWLTYNNYRQNVQGNGSNKPTSTPDFTGGLSTGIDPMAADCLNAWSLRALVCNRGTAVANPGIPGTFYSSDPRMANPKVICTTPGTQNSLNPGDCEAVECLWKNPPQNPIDLYFQSNDDGTDKPLLPECHNGNDILFMPQAVCMKIG